jgi:hypothetical protein
MEFQKKTNENITHIKDTPRKLLGGMYNMSTYGMADTFGHTGNITPTQDLSNLIESIIQEDREKLNLADCFWKYGWHQETVDINESGSNCRRVYKFDREQDLVQNLILVFDSEQLLCDVNFDVHTNDDIYKIIKNIEIHMGGQRIENIHGHTIKFMQQLYKMDYYFEKNNKTLRTGTGKIYVPIPFDCCVNQPIRLASLKQHDVELCIRFKDFGFNPKFNLQLKYDSIFVSSRMRKELSQRAFEYIVKQVQFTGDELLNNNTTIQTYRLGFNHPSIGLLLYLTDMEGNLIKDENIFEDIVICEGDMKLFQGDSDYMRYDGLMHLGCYDSINNDKWDGFYWMPFTRKEDLRHDSSFRSYSAFNFSVPNNANVKVKLNANFVKKSDKDNNAYIIHISTVNYHLSRIMNGMIGLAMSK